VQRRKATHGESDDVRSFDTEMIENRDDIVAGVFL